MDEKVYLTLSNNISRKISFLFSCPGMEPGSPALQVDSLPLSHQGGP